MTFIDSEGLRSLLFRLYATGPDAWRDDPEVAELMAYAMDKYGALARRHGQTPEDAAAVTYEVLRTRPVRWALDPWAMVTHAVELSLTAEERATGMLCSNSRARKPEMADYHDAERLSDRESSLADYHPAFHSAPEQDLAVLVIDAERKKKADEAKKQHDADGEDEHDETAEEEPKRLNAFEALDVIVDILVAFGWPEPTARSTLEFIGVRLMHSETRQAAYERLRRDRMPWLRFDLDMEVWGTVLRVLLGAPDSDHAKTAAGQGMWKRVCQGYDVDRLLADHSLVKALATSARLVRRRRSHV